MYSRSTDRCEREAVIYRSNLPPRYSGNRFAEAESEQIVGECGECEEECGAREEEKCAECSEEKCRRHRFSRKRYGKCRLCPTCEQEGDGECGGDGRGLSAILPIGLGKEELTLAVILLLIAREGGTNSHEIMVILALLLAVR